MRRIALFGALLILSVAPTRGQAFITSNTTGIQLPTYFSFAYQNIPYCTTPAIMGTAVGTVTWSLSGSLPTGLTQNTATGSICGTPTGTGASSFTLSWHDSATPPHGATGLYGITVTTLMSIAVGPTGQSVQESATQQMTANATWANNPPNNAPLNITQYATWTCTTGAGCGTVSSLGVFTAAAATGSATLQASFNGVNGSTTVAVVNNNPAPTIQTNPILPTPGCVVGFPCTPVQLSATGGSGTGYTYAIVSGAPTGCGSSLTSGGYWSCTPTASGNFNALVIRVTDSMAGTSTTTFTQLVGSAMTSTASVSPATVAVNGQTQATGIETFSDGSTQNVTIGNAGLNRIQTQQCSATGSSCTITWNPPITLGDNIHLGMRQGADIVSAFSATDPSSQTYSAVGSNNVTSGDDIGMIQTTNSAAIASTTCATAAASSSFECIGYEVAGEVPSTSNIDVTANNTSSGTGTSDVTAPLTTTNANDFLLDFGGQTGSAISWSGTNPFSIPTNGFINRTGSQFEIVNQTTSGLTAQLNWATSAPAAHSSIFAAFKAASSGGTVWSAANGTGSCRINTSAAITGLTAGTCLISFTYNGGAASSPVTVTVTGGAVDTGLLLCPSPAKCTPPITFSGTAPSGTVQVYAVGNVTGNTYNAPPTVWASNNTSLVPSRQNGLFGCTGNTPTPVTITATNGALTSGPGSVNCSTPGTAGLLSTAVVTGCGTMNIATPAGWTLALVDRFDGGKFCHSSGEGVFGGGTAINCNFGHSGQCSISDVISFNGAATQWYYSQGQIPGRTFYLSYWDYANGALFNTEYLNGHIIKTGIGTQGCGGANNKVACPGYGQEELGLNTFVGDYCNVFNCASPPSVTGMQGNFVNATQSQKNGAAAPNYGSTGWNHWEFWFHANTPGASDGFERVYLNGKLFNDYEAFEFFGNVDMTGMQVEAGGWYTKNIWTYNPPGGTPPSATCATTPGGQGSSEDQSLPGNIPFGTLASYCGPLVPTFTRYISDIILMTQ